MAFGGLKPADPGSAARRGVGAVPSASIAPGKLRLGDVALRLLGLPGEKGGVGGKVEGR